MLFRSDRLDAQLIAEYVSIKPTRVVQRVATAERLAEVVTMRRSFATSMSRSKTRPLMLRMLYCGASTNVASRGLKADIHLLDKRLAEIVAADALLAQRYELLTSMRGVGPTLAFTLIALLPELGQMSRRSPPSSVSPRMTSTVAGSKDIAASTVVGCQSVTCSTWQL